MEWLGVDNDGLPTSYVIHQNYPNPFNPVTTLRYDLPEDADVNITIYDMMGRQVSTLVSSQQGTNQCNGTLPMMLGLQLVLVSICT
jgi:hypothetical protein